jgi:capsid protein
MYSYRNPTYNQHGTVDCEIEHPVYGWVPFTADPNDINADGRSLHAAIVETGGIAEYVAPTLSADELQEAVVSAIQTRLDLFAQTRKYDNMLSACTYASSQVAKFAAEGQYCVQMRDQTWATAYQLLQDVENGTRPVPNSYAAIENELPALTWPL